MAHAQTENTGDRRIIEETGVDKRIADLIEPLLATMGFRLIRVRLSSRNDFTLQIMLEREDGTMTVEDCEEASRALSPFLDIEDPVDRPYNLEVSSPGIDRPLVWQSDFHRWRGHAVKVETDRLVDGRKRFGGILAEVSGDAIVLDLDKPAYGSKSNVELPFDVLADIRLVLTDELVRQALRDDKKARKSKTREDDPDD